MHVWSVSSTSGPAEGGTGIVNEKSDDRTSLNTTRSPERRVTCEAREKYFSGDSPSRCSVSADSAGERNGSSPRPLSHRHRAPVRGLNSCSCHPSPKPKQARDRETSK